jgi:hypothetical protein
VDVLTTVPCGRTTGTLVSVVGPTVPRKWERNDRRRRKFEMPSYIIAGSQVLDAHAARGWT